ncbi:hypothetical protein ONZ51_g8963 [Trametes cubensis]|uniref:Uncharacterized protein n=1 Tax=Trametes cubensis TaxID=1111947 RepID=A0AAD7X852_9APHY|nr:hypothetical protein ONZ51_g8963 [Trametes cubensis]
MPLQMDKGRDARINIKHRVAPEDCTVCWGPAWQHMAQSFLGRPSASSRRRRRPRGSPEMWGAGKATESRGYRRDAQHTGDTAGALFSELSCGPHENRAGRRNFGSPASSEHLELAAAAASPQTARIHMAGGQGGADGDRWESQSSASSVASEHAQAALPAVRTS